MKNKNIAKFVLVITIISITFFSNINFAEDLITFDEIINSKDFLEILELDRIYLESQIHKDDNLLSEIEILNKEIEKLKTEYEVTKSGARLYDPETSGLLHSLSNGLENRKELMRCSKLDETFTYSDNKFFTPLGDIDISTNLFIPKQIQEFNYEQTKLVLDNIDIDPKHTKDIVVVISPFRFSGLKAFSYSEISEGRHDMIVISSHELGVALDSDYLVRSVRGSVLHELGHIFHMSQEAEYYGLGDTYVDRGQLEDSDVPFWKEYYKIYDFKESSNWSSTAVESLAEDFRIYYSRKLGDISFEPLGKNSIYKYDPQVEELFEKYSDRGKDIDEKSFADVNINANNKAFTNLSTSSSTDYVVNEATKDMEINLDKRNVKFDNYRLYKWDENSSFMGEEKLRGDSWKMDLLGKDSDVNIITLAVVNGRDSMQKWRIDLIR